MTSFASVPDRLLKLIKEKVPDFPLCTAECVTWSMEHHSCQGCRHYTRCNDLVSGVEIGRRYMEESRS